YNASEDIYYIYFDSSQVSSFTFSANDFDYAVSHDYVGQNYFTVTCNGSYSVSFYDSSNNLLSSDTVNLTNINNQNSACQQPPSDGGGNGSGGDCGCIFNTPGWSDYMGKIDDVINAIPSPPNWQQVANTFNNTIVPNLISETESMLGYAPSAPSAPNYSDTITGYIDEPTGQNAEGLEDSSFTADDIKDGAEDIEVRDDPSGGFDILDPVESLPSEEEFRENIPDEGEVDIPEVPEPKAEIPEEPELEADRPESPEIEAEPPDPGGVDGEAPQPGNEGGTAPIPGDRENTAPTPGDNGFNAPIPGGSGNNAPLPGSDMGDVPLPGESGTAPLP
ncbi:hypothetical protein, partial [Amphibacillus jilinensis]|uniref:hypothetical protein n=1 Tax=Amphibacillus jilinensis TaxID=1216008 RepID=UPI00188600E8